MSIDAGSYPDLDADERTTLGQFLDQYRQRVLYRLTRLSDAQARTKTLTATNLTPGGVVKHLAHMEDHWFTARVGGGALPEPWISAPFDVQPRWDFESALDDSVHEIAELYRKACERSRSVAARLSSLDTKAPRPSFGKSPVTLRWVMVHLLEETACHVGHLDLLTDPPVRQEHRVAPHLARQSTSGSLMAPLIGSARCAWLTTLQKDGSPHTTPVWFLFEDDRFWIASSKKNVKVRNVSYDPRVSVAIDGSGAHPYVAEGRARIHHLGDHPGLIALFAEKYAGWDVTDERSDGPRILLEVPVDRWLLKHMNKTTVSGSSRPLGVKAGPDSGD